MKYKMTYVSLLLLLIIVLVSCGDRKSPDPGYMNEDELTEIVKTFDSKSYHSFYTYEGKFNYFGESYVSEITLEEIFPETIEGGGAVNESFSGYSRSCSSYFLGLPLHITYENWSLDLKEISAEDNYPSSTKYRLESSLYRTSVVNDNIYYYAREDGGFIAKGFGVNHTVLIKNPIEIEAHGKWNFYIEYDKNGYLVCERVESLDASESNKKNCIYVDMIYSYD